MTRNRNNIHWAITTLMVLIFCCTTSTDAALVGELGLLDLDANGGINPATNTSWQLGDEYRLAFVTSGTRDATSANMADYDAFVQSAANNSTLGLGSATWKALGSTVGLNSRDHTGTTASLGGAIFLVDGITKVADNYNDFWDNSLDNPMSMTENGDVITSNTNVWAGMFASGAPEATRHLGTTFDESGVYKAHYGRATDTNAYWARVYNAATSTDLRFYGLSDPLEVMEAGPPPEGFEFVAYHDLGGEASPGNITTQTSIGATVDLINFADGADTNVNFSISGANGIDVRTGTVTRPPAAGTPAGDLFLASGIDLDDGLVYEGGNGGSGSTTFTFSGLDPDFLYDVALYGDRNASADGVERFTLEGVDEATNISSIGIIDDFTTDMETRPNAPDGELVRWTDIAPGSDGIFTIDIDPEFTSLSNLAYLSAVRLEAIAVAVPEPTTFALAALSLLGAITFIRRRKR